LVVGVKVDSFREPFRGFLEVIVAEIFVTFVLVFARLPKRGRDENEDRTKENVKK